MAVASPSWHMSALFRVALAAESAVTVDPGGETTGRLNLAAWPTLAIFSTMAAAAIKRLRLAEPTRLIRTSPA